MPRTLYYLVKASGNSGASGQTFRNHVKGDISGNMLAAISGAGSGVKMSDYNVTDWTWDGASGPTTLGWPYASGTSWTIPITFTEGAKAKVIRRTALDGLGYPIRVLSYSADMAIVGEDIEITSRTISNTDSTASATLRLISSMPPTGQTISYTTYAYRHDTGAGPYSPDSPGYATTPGSGVLLDGVIEITSLSPGTLRNVTYTIDIDYIPDIGPYNPTLTKQYVIQATDRTVVASTDLDVQWSWDQSTIESQTGYIYNLPTQSAVGDDFTIYYRWRLLGSTGSYTAWTAANWVDSRLF